MTEILKILSNVIRVLSAKERRNWIILFCLSTLVSIADVLSVTLLILVIGAHTDVVVNPNILTSFLLANPLISFFYLGAYVVLKNWIASLIIEHQFRFSYQVAHRVSSEELKLFFNKSYTNYSSTTSSSLIRRISFQPIEFCQYILAGFQQIINELVLILIVIAVLFVFTSGMIILLFIVLAMSVYAVSFFIKSRLARIRENIRQINERVLQFLQESLNGFVEASIFGKKNFFINRFSKEQAALNQYLATLQALQSNSHRILETFGIIGLFLLFVSNAYTSLPGSQSVINIGIFLGAAYKLIPGTIKIINLSSQIKTFGYSAEGFPIPTQSESNSNLPDINESLDSIIFDKVSFSYQGKSILNNFSFSLIKGDFVSVIAPSGRGKTTFINLLVGFLEEESGSIQFNSKILGASHRKFFWPKISYLKQDTFLINDSILKNILLDDNGYDEKRLSEALYASGLYNFISEQKAGIEYLIAEDGKNISGGQRQRIGLARTLYKKSDIYIFDEAMNELDRESEMQVLVYLKKLADQGHIVILVSHTSRSHNLYNKIIVLDGEK